MSSDEVYVTGNITLGSHHKYFIATRAFGCQVVDLKKN